MTLNVALKAVDDAYEEKLAGDDAKAREFVKKEAEKLLAQAAEAAALEAAAEAQARTSKRALMVSFARTVVALAAEAGGHDSRFVRPGDTITADNIAEQLIAVMDAKAVELPSAFRQLSAPADLAKAEAISGAIAAENT